MKEGWGKERSFAPPSPIHTFINPVVVIRIVQRRRCWGKRSFAPFPNTCSFSSPISITAPIETGIWVGEGAKLPALLVLQVIETTFWVGEAELRSFPHPKPCFYRSNTSTWVSRLGEERSSAPPTLLPQVHVLLISTSLPVKYAGVWERGSSASLPNTAYLTGKLKSILSV